MRNYSRILHLVVCLASLVYLVLLSQHPSFTVAWSLLCLQLFGIYLSWRHPKEIESETRHTSNRGS